MSNPAIQNLIISLVGMQVAKRVPFDDPTTLNYVRVGYVSAQVLVLTVYYYTSMKVKQKNDQTVLKYVEAGNPLTQQPGELVTTTVKDYDLSEISKLVRSTYMALAMMAFLHLYMKYTQPLFIQGIMAAKNLYDAKLVQIHIFGKPATGDLKRPFKSGGGMFGAGGEPATDKAAIDEAEKKAGPKKDE